jgi:hypothetical protein
LDDHISSIKEVRSREGKAEIANAIGLPSMNEYPITPSNLGIPRNRTLQAASVVISSNAFQSIARATSVDTYLGIKVRFSTRIDCKRSTASLLNEYRQKQGDNASDSSRTTTKNHTPGYFKSNKLERNEDEQILELTLVFSTRPQVAAPSKLDRTVDPT